MPASDGRLVTVPGDARLLELAARARRHREFREAAATLDEARAGAGQGAARWPSIGLDIATARRQAGVDFSRSSSLAEARPGPISSSICGGASPRPNAMPCCSGRPSKRVAQGLGCGSRAPWQAAGSPCSKRSNRGPHAQRGQPRRDPGGHRGQLSPRPGRVTGRLSRAQRTPSRNADACSTRHSAPTPRRRLEEVLGDYPAAAIAAAPTLPAVPEAFAAGLPADLLTRRPDVRAGWLTPARRGCRRCGRASRALSAPGADRRRRAQRAATGRAGE